MSVAVTDVPAWLIQSGIAHAVAGPGFGSGWGMMACGMQTPCRTDDFVNVPPKRICSRCRAALAGATLRKT